MAVKLRLRREGTKKKPHYRIVAADTRSPRDGRFIEILGDYHPLANPSVINVNEERALYWLGVGAQPTAQVENLLRITGVWEQFRPDDTAKPQVDEAAPKRPSKKARAKAEEAAAASSAKAEPAEAPAADADAAEAAEATEEDAE